MTTLQHWHHGFESPFKSEIYFVNTTRFQNLKWGTKNPIICRDPEFGPVRIRAYGTYTIRVSNPAQFLREIVGTDGEFTTDEITYQIRNNIVARASAALASSGIPVLDMAANTMDLGKLIAAKVSPELAEFGIEMPAFYIENISLPSEVEAALDKRTSMGVAGDLWSIHKVLGGEAMTSAASNPAGGGMGDGLGMGMGMAMAGQMAQGLSQPATLAHRLLQSKRSGISPTTARQADPSAVQHWEGWRQMAHLRGNP